MALSGSVSPESMVFDSSFSANSTSAGISRSRSGSVVFAFARQLEVGLDIVGAARELRIVGKQGLQPLALAHQRLRSRGIGPDGGVGNLFFDDGQFRAAAGPSQRYSRRSRTLSRTGEYGIPDHQHPPSLRHPNHPPPPSPPPPQTSRHPDRSAAKWRDPRIRPCLVVNSPNQLPTRPIHP